MNNIIYLVQVCSGQYDYYHERQMFATKNKEIAEKWCNKYNRIVTENRDRISRFYSDGDYEKIEPFMYDIINFEEPIAQMVKIELR